MMTIAIALAALAITSALVALALVHLRVTRSRVDQLRIIELERELGMRPGSVSRDDVLRMLLRAYDGPGLIEVDGRYLDVTMRGGLVTRIGRLHDTPDAAITAVYPALKEIM